MCPTTTSDPLEGAQRQGHFKALRRWVAVAMDRWSVFRAFVPVMMKSRKKLAKSVQHIF